MYLEPRKNRLLLTDGTSLVTSEEYARLILGGGEIHHSIKVEPSTDSDTYQSIYGVDIAYQGEPEPNVQEYPTIDLYDLILDTPDKFPRIGECIEENGDDAMVRLVDEIEFFQKNNSFLIQELIKLVDTFKEAGVVWGCGRGSSCASLLLYVIEVHDINPLKYQIPFSELSKESKSEY